MDLSKYFYWFLMVIINSTGRFYYWMMPDKKIFDLTDEGLLESARDDDQTAFKEIYKRYWPKLYIYAYNVLREKDICEDIIQEVFTNLWIRRKSAHIENVSAFLYQAVKFQIFKQFRQRKLLDRHSNEFDDFISNHRIEEMIRICTHKGALSC